VFLIMLYTQVENLERPWNCPRFRNAARRLSCRTSSESCEFRIIRLAALASPGIQEANSSFTSRALMRAGRFPASGISPAVPEFSLQAKRPSSSGPRRGWETIDSMHARDHCRSQLDSCRRPAPGERNDRRRAPLTSAEWASPSHSAAPRELGWAAVGAANLINGDTGGGRDSFAFFPFPVRFSHSSECDRGTSASAFLPFLLNTKDLSARQSSSTLAE